MPDILVSRYRASDHIWSSSYDDQGDRKEYRRPSQSCCMHRGVQRLTIDQIDEFISGEPGRLFYENGEQAQIIQSFREIYGIGRNLANELYRRGARSIDDLRNGHFGLTYGQRVRRFVAFNQSSR